MSQSGAEHGLFRGEANRLTWLDESMPGDQASKRYTTGWFDPEQQSGGLKEGMRWLACTARRPGERGTRVKLESHH